jgi:phenylalanyl-tRNA synthetase beta chain
MKVLYSWLQDYIAEPMPSVEVAVDALTNHSSEIESIETVHGDTVMDVKVLPDRAHDMLSHRGIARELAAILNLKLSDKAKTISLSLPQSQELENTIQTTACPRFATALIKHIQIGPSPTWLRDRLERLGQRSINNVVDATNYVMLSLGQPLHAYDADKITKKDTKYCLQARDSREGDRLVTLDGVERTLPAGIPLIVDCVSGLPLGIAGVKGGTAAEVTDRTHTIILEAANFDSVRVRQVAKGLGIRTEASARYENHISPSLVPEGLDTAAKLITEIAGTDKTVIEGYTDLYPEPLQLTPVTITLSTISSILGADISQQAVEDILTRTRCTFQTKQENNDVVFTITPPADRLDLELEEDVVDHIARLWGYDNLSPQSLPDIAAAGVVQFKNPAFYYTAKIRDTLINLGFTEISTYAFRADGDREVVKPLAADKRYLRRMQDALDFNIRNADLHGTRQVKLFELGTVFSKEGEHLALALGVRNSKGVKEKEDDIVEAAIAQVSKVLHRDMKPDVERGIVEINLSQYLPHLPEPKDADYALLQQFSLTPHTYQPFSPYPFSVRDVAVWVPLDVKADAIETIIRERAGTLLKRLELFDTFKKELMPGVRKLSYAFRLVLQAPDHTLTEEEITSVMQAIYADFATHEGWTVR